LSVQTSLLHPVTTHLGGGGETSSLQHTAKRSSGSMLQVKPAGQGDPPRPQKASLSGSPVGHVGAGTAHRLGEMHRSGWRGRVDDPAITVPLGQPHPGPMAALHKGMGWSHEAGQPSCTSGRYCWLAGHFFLESLPDRPRRSVLVVVDQAGATSKEAENRTVRTNRSIVLVLCLRAAHSGPVASCSWTSQSTEYGPSTVSQ
jgi:hypothetical protein